MDDVAPHRYPSRAHSDATPGRGIHPPRAPRVHYGTAVHDGSAILPLLTAIVSAVLAARVGGAAVRRFSPSKPFWAAGLLAFAIAAAAEAYGAADGWGAASFRLYYLFGGCLCVALLGIGSAWLVLPRSIALVISGMAATAVVAAAVAVLLAPVDLARLAGTHGTAPPVNAAIGGHVFLWAIVLNVAGSLLVSGGSLVSLARRRRTVANVLILAGVVTVAGSGTLTRLGDYGFVYVGQAAGIVLLAIGFELAERHVTDRARRRGLGVSAARSRPTAS